MKTVRVNLYADEIGVLIDRLNNAATEAVRTATSKPIEETTEVLVGLGDRTAYFKKALGRMAEPKQTTINTEDD